MELSDETLDGLGVLNDVDAVPGAILETLLADAADRLTRPDGGPENPAFLGHDRGVLKRAGVALATLMLEAAKHDAGPGAISSALEDLVSSDRAEAVAKKYEESKARLRLTLASIGTHFDVVEDVDWKLDYAVSGEAVGRMGQVKYLVSLKGPTLKDGIKFSCSYEDLQDLVGKLKNACKSLEQIAQS